MKKDSLFSIKKWFLLILFASYVSGISFFTHTHTIDHIVYVHSHPYKKSEQKKHTHTHNELHILDLYYHTTLTEDVVEEFDLTDYSSSFRVIYAIFYEGVKSVDRKDTTLLRAPPAA